MAWVIHTDSSDPPPFGFCYHSINDLKSRKKAEEIRLKYVLTLCGSNVTVNTLRAAVSSYNFKRNCRNHFPPPIFLSLPLQIASLNCFRICVITLEKVVHNKGFVIIIIVKQLFFFPDKVNLMTKLHYDNVVEDRSFSKRCGYPLCNNQLSDTGKQRFSILQNYGVIVDVTEAMVRYTTF